MDKRFNSISSLAILPVGLAVASTQAGGLIYNSLLKKEGIKMARPDYVKEEHLIYLDELRESGVANMFGARPYLIEEFGSESKVAGNILMYWMKTFGKRVR